MWNADVSRLTPQEAVIADYAERDPLQFATKSGAEIAAIVHTSEATIARTARKLGFANFREMKSHCARTIQETANLQGVLRDRLEAMASTSDERTGPTSAVLRDAASLVLGIEATLSEAAIEPVIRAIVKRRRTFVYGLGTAYAFAQYAEIEFSRIGIDAKALSGGGHTNAHAAFQISAHDAVVVLAPRLLLVDVISFTLAVQRAGAAVFVVTQESLPDELAAVRVGLLRLPHSGGLSATDAVSTVALIDVLVAEVARHGPQRALEARARAQQYRDEFSS